MTLKLTIWELRAKSKITTKVLRLQIIHLYNSTLTLCIWYYQAVLLLNDVHYKSDCILLAIFREMLNKSSFKLLAYIPILPRLLVLHKTLQRYLWNIVNITEIQERCSDAWCVCCTSDASVALTTLRGTRQVARMSFTAKSYRFVLIFSCLYRCIVSYTKYRDPLIYRCIVSPLEFSEPKAEQKINDHHETWQTSSKPKLTGPDSYGAMETLWIKSSRSGSECLGHSYGRVPLLLYHTGYSVSGQPGVHGQILTCF